MYPDFQHHIQHLQHHIEHQQALSRRFSWLRLLVFVVGTMSVWTAATWRSAAWGWAIFVIALGIFSVIAWLHRRLEGWIETFQIGQRLKTEALARRNLDWDHLPATSLPADRSRSALDIDLDLTGSRSLHHLIDTSNSADGSQRLADWLTQSAPDLAQVSDRQQLVRELLPLGRFRYRLLLHFRRISEDILQSTRLTRWLNEPYPAAHLGWWLLVASLFVAANLILFALNVSGRLPAYWMLSLLGYFVFYNLVLSPLGKFLGSIVEMEGELVKFRSLLLFLEQYPLRDCPRLLALCRPFRDPASRPSRQLRWVRWVAGGVALRMNPILALIVNLLLPWDFLFAVLANRCRLQMERALPPWLDTWYELEALTSLANFAALHPEYTFPELVRPADIGDRPVYQALALGHPLIPAAQRIANDFTVQRTGSLAIVTGSNMSGKSTFIKSVGVNLCLAYAGGPVCAARLRTIPFRLATCIRITDSVTDGYSYFYAEVKCLKGVLDALQAPDALPLLYLIDEIFRGTNNRERLIGSRAYVRALLASNGVGFLATHDLELTSLAGEHAGALNFHFRDDVAERRLVFDYKIHPGPSPTTNALKIMQVEGLPIDVDQRL